MIPREDIEEQEREARIRGEANEQGTIRAVTGALDAMHEVLLAVVNEGAVSVHDLRTFTEASARLLGVLSAQLPPDVSEDEH
jgi:hypothetical protein